jgi:hypothetical protein
MSIADDETKAALRRVCDRHAGTIDLGHTFPKELVHEIFASLPNGSFGAVAGTATGADDGSVALSVNHAVYGHIAYAAEYWSGLVLRHRKLQTA